MCNACKLAKLKHMVLTALFSLPASIKCTKCIPSHTAKEKPKLLIYNFLVICSHAALLRDYHGSYICEPLTIQLAEESSSIVDKEREGLETVT